MKGIKLGIVGVCVSLLGMAFAADSPDAIFYAGVGLFLAIIGFFVKDK